MSEYEEFFCLHNYVREQDLVSCFYKHAAFLRVFFIKELAHSVIAHTFFDWAGHTEDETFLQDT